MPHSHSGGTGPTTQRRSRGPRGRSGHRSQSPARAQLPLGSILTPARAQALPTATDTGESESRPGEPHSSLTAQHLLWPCGHCTLPAPQPCWPENMSGTAVASWPSGAFPGELCRGPDAGHPDSTATLTPSLLGPASGARPAWPLLRKLSPARWLGVDGSVAPDASWAVITAHVSWAPAGPGGHSSWPVSNVGCFPRG